MSKTQKISDLKKVEKPSEKEILEQKIKELEKQDIEGAKEALNKFFASQEWTKYGCRIIVQGQFIADKIQASLLVVKDK